MKKSTFTFLVTLLLGSLCFPVISMILGSRLGIDSNSTPGSAAEFGLDLDKRTLQLSVEAEFAWKSGAIAYAPHWGGVVSAVHVANGDELAQGDPVFELDGVEIRYYVSSTPLYQQVCLGSSRLVTEVRSILEVAGHPVGTGDKIDRTDRAAIRDYAQSIVVPGHNQLECFDPAWVLTSKEPLTQLDEAALIVGTPPPNAFSPTLVGKGLIQEIVLSDSTGSRVVVGSTPGQVGIPADAMVIANGVETDLLLSDIYPVTDPHRVSKWFTSDAANNMISLNVNLSERQYLVPATAVVDALGETACVEEAGNGRVHEVSVIGSTMNGLIIEFHAEPAVVQFRLEPDQHLCG